jgi:hypothetical protein
MKKSDTFVWTMQADAAFKELKQMLSTTPVLASPLPKEPMLLYIAATNRVVSAVVVVEREEGGKSMQRPVYYCHIPKFCRFWYVKRINKLIELFEFV